MPTARRTSSLIVALLVVAGCSGDNTPPRTAHPDIPLESYETNGLSVARANFCDLLEPAAVKRALGGEATSIDHYGTGVSVELSPGVTDIAHEHNCTFSSDDGVVARGWVFAPPVTAARADDLGQQALKMDGCMPIVGAADFGNPSLATTCRANGTSSVAFHGLFVDAWLSCSVTAPATTGKDDLLNRANLWCAAVAKAAHDAFT